MTTKRKQVTAACNECRRRKVRCDATRPICHRCIDQGSPHLCVFDISPGETRCSNRTKQLEVTREELNGFQELVETLRSASPTSAQNALDHLRASGDSAAFTRLFTNDQALYLERHPTPSRIKAEPSSIANSPRQAHLYQDGIRAAVDAFFLHTGKLFQVFTREEIEPLFDRVFESEIYDDETSVKDGSAIAKLYSVGAVGSSYMQIPPGKHVERFMHEKAKIHLEDVVETGPLEAAKVCSLLAQRLVFDKHKAAMVYVRTGLDISQSAGMHSPSRPPHLSHSAWVDGRKVWRTLFFFACWLSATVGFGDEWVLGEPCVTNVDLPGDKSIEEFVQTEMVKIAVLKFGILRMNITFNDHSPRYGLSIKPMTDDLERWYARLPQEMQLLNITHASVSTEVRRTVYFMHLLYLGCLMLLSRRFMSTSSVGGCLDATTTASTTLEIASCNKQAVVAAEQSARILGVLLTERGVFKGCWVCIFQAFVSAALILHDIAKQPMSPCSFERIAEQLAHAAQCLEVLRFCRADDQAADMFYTSLLPYHERLKELARDATVRDAWDDTIAARLSKLVRVPFGEHDNGAEILTTKSWKQSDEANNRYDHFGLVERVDRDFEATNPFAEKFHFANLIGPDVEMT